MSILFGGDIFFNEKKVPIISHDFLTKAIKESEFFSVNLEGPVFGDANKGIDKVGPLKFQSKNTLDFLKSAGVNKVCLANNHIMDAGMLGLVSTIDLLDKTSISFFGLEDRSGGSDKKIARVEVEGKSLSIIGVAEEEFNSPLIFGRGAFIIDEIEIWRVVKQEIDSGREVVVVFHGGVEHEILPPPWLRRLGHWLIDLGARAVITHHCHVPGHVEVYKGCPIAWSLGNFWFSNFNGEFKNNSGYVVELSFQNDNFLNWKIIPYYSDYQAEEIREMRDDELLKWQDHVAFFDKVMNSEKLYNDWWNSFFEKKKNGYIYKYSLSPFPRSVSKWVIKILRKCKNEYWKIRQLNGLRCRSHREIWTQALLKSYFDEKND